MMKLAYADTTDSGAFSENNYFSISDSETDQAQPSKVVIHQAASGNKTDQYFDKKDNLYKFHSTAPAMAATHDSSELKKEVNGAIDEICEFGITCELEIKNNTYVKIQLPPSFFQQDVFVGMPITLSLDNSTGYLIPSVKRRELSHEFQKMYQEEIDSLIAELP